MHCQSHLHRHVPPQQLARRWFLRDCGIGLGAVALQQLTGLPIDSKTTALLCGRTYSSTLFIQNLARWSAAPPPLVAHLLRQEALRRSPMLRTLLMRHPNAPAAH